MNRVLLTVGCAAATLLLSTWLADANQASVLDLPPGDLPVTVTPAFQLLAIHNVNDEAETFEFSGVLTLVWNDPRQAFDPVAEGVEEKFYHGDYQFSELSPAWYPQLVLGNATGSTESDGVLLRVKPDGTSTLIQTVNAVARSRMDLHGYPFDKQRLEAVFLVLGFDRSEVVLAADAKAASASLAAMRVPQWDITSFQASTRIAASPYTGTGGKSSVFILTLEMRRQSFFMVRLVLMPLVLIVVLSWSVFWMDRSSLGDRMAVSFVGILTAVSYQILVSDVMPQISYITFMNGFLSFSFLVMCATAVVNLVVGECDKRGRSGKGDLIDHRCRWIFPAVYFALIVVDAVFSFLW